MARGRKRGESTTNILIEFDESWYVKSDNVCFTLCKKRGGEGAVDENVGYYGSIAALLQGYLDHRTKRSSAHSWEQLAEEIQTIKNHISNIDRTLSPKSG